MAKRHKVEIRCGATGEVIPNDIKFFSATRSNTTTVVPLSEEAIARIPDEQKRVGMACRRADRGIDIYTASYGPASDGVVSSEFLFSISKKTAQQYLPSVRDKLRSGTFCRS
jgi:hypothetical protein